MTFSDLWTEASRDVEAERRLKAMEIAKNASRGIWAFLAQAENPVEYGDRLALAQDRIEAVASSAGVPTDDLLGVFEQRFALLTEAKDNPFGDDDSDSDNTDEDGDGSTDDDGEDGDKGDETDSGGDKDDSDDSDTNEDDDSDSDDNPDDPNPDDDDESQEKDPDQDGDDDSSPQGDTDHDFFPRSSARYAALHARIAAGENPLNWGGSPFVGSPARKTAAVGADAGASDGIVSDTNVPQPGEMGAGPGGGVSLPETTKPRQLPGGPQSLDVTGQQPMDPALNGGDVGAGADEPPDTQRQAKIAAIAAEVRQHNPHLSAQQCARVAFQVVGRYYKQAENLSPLLYGDRGNVTDGPLTKQIKDWQPPSPQPKMPGGGGGGSAEEDEAGAGEAAAEEGAGNIFPEIAPLVL